MKRILTDADPLLLRCEKEGIQCDFIIKDQFIHGITASANYHFHSTYEMHVPVKGNMHIMVEDTDILLQPGQICVIPPQLTHYIYADTTSYRVGFRFAFTSLSEDHCAVGTSSHPFLQVYAPLTNILIADHCCIYDKYLSVAAQNIEAGLPEYFAADLLYLALSDIAYHVAQNPREPLPSQTHSPDLFLTEQIEEFINTHYGESICLENLSCHIHLGKRQTQRILRRFFHLTFSELLNRKRLSAAKLLLKTSDMPIDRIALFCGYENINYFYRKFSQAYQITPGQYRRKHQE